MLIASLVIATFVLLYNYASAIVSAMALGIILVLFTALGSQPLITAALCWAVLTPILVLLNVKKLRSQLLTRPIFAIFKKVTPTMSETERAALEAGTVGWESEFFTGNPDWKRFADISNAKLSIAEQAFLDGPTEELCNLIDGWQISQYELDIPEKIWNFITANGFFGMIIPKEYGGLGFSAVGHSAVITKIASKNASVGTTVSVPNSLGPAELLLHYGTEDQKSYYLPRLAKAEEIPCFALTSPSSGSDAASLVDNGIVCHHDVDGKSVLGVRLNWNKRYITLSPKATVIGLAFKLFDPEHLLSANEERGITLALVPANLPGVTTGRRHYPLYATFPNGPTQGKDVFITMDQLIGGEKYIGQGWKMLMQCLAAGRCISLPAMVTGAGKLYPAAVSAYARIRKQFGVPLSAFEGIQEALTRIISNGYIMESMRLFSANNVDRGEESAVASAICKYHVTEMGRQIVESANDVLGGKAICMGPRNMTADSYTIAPVSITVEGANILTRNLIIFGQGAIRCHPYVLAEMESALETNTSVGLRKFDKLFFAHVGLVLSNAVRSFALGITNSRLCLPPKTNNKVESNVYRQITRFSATFSFVSDICMMLFGSKLKRMEGMSAKLGDIFSALYMLSSTAKYFSNSENKSQEEVLFAWSANKILLELQSKLDQLLCNIKPRLVRVLLRIICMPLGFSIKQYPDSYWAKITNLFTKPTEVRDRLLKDIYTADVKSQLGFMLKALPTILEADESERKLQRAIKTGQISGLTLTEQLKSARAIGLLTEQQEDLVLESDRLRQEVVAVDDFSDEELQHSFKGGPEQTYGDIHG